MPHAQALLNPGNSSLLDVCEVLGIRFFYTSRDCVHPPSFALTAPGSGVKLLSMRFSSQGRRQQGLECPSTRYRKRSSESGQLLSSASTRRRGRVPAWRITSPGALAADPFKGVKMRGCCQTYLYILNSTTPSIDGFPSWK